MPWSIHAEGHCPDERAERLLIDRLRLVLTTASVGCDTAIMHTDHHGEPNLLDAPDVARDESGV